VYKSTQLEVPQPHQRRLFYSMFLVPCTERKADANAMWRFYFPFLVYAKAMLNQTNVIAGVFEKNDEGDHALP